MPQNKIAASFSHLSHFQSPSIDDCQMKVVTCHISVFLSILVEEGLPNLMALSGILKFWTVTGIFWTVTETNEGYAIIHLHGRVRDNALPLDPICHCFFAPRDNC